ncbi:hypothetical protein [Brunnivagina elsteri]|uniref:DUF6788 domain-containing protein n=1 Tax=Brunnivagina elsteri CCALA 953 TaxID=987040 RepID=A0A2A2TN60_9CYAN|nr:hypothetical protein [Calothrix elsteri]PAX59872.1 hypothetical protein CK510_04800 [Calothrix elsteri CCALA 953]
MRKTKLPLVTDVDYLGIMIGSDAWLNWLEQTTSFRYEPRQQGKSLLYEITVRQRGKYWYAYRKVNNRLRQFYLAKSENLDWERLQLAVDFLSQSEADFYRNRETVRQKVCTTESTPEQLRSRIVELEAKCRKLETENFKLKSGM